ncbi:MAG: MFS transporter [Alphaproteobacteria bacterium]
MKASTPVCGKIPITIWILGFMMLFANTSYTMVFGLSAVYLRNVMGVSSGWIGLLDGVAEGISFAMKLLSGVVSDYFRRRKIIMVIGYIMMVVSRPIIAIAPGFGAIFTARFIERIGNGIQGTPRDALVSDIAPPHKKGESFGLMRSIGIAGSFMGCILGLFLMKWTVNNYQLIFWLASIPIVIAALLLIFAVREPQQNLNPRDHKPRHPIHFSDIPRLGNRYWLLMMVVAIFMLARVSETFLVLHANQTFSLAEAYAPLIMILYNVTYCLSAYPIGKLSDKISRYTLLCIACGVLVLASLILWTSASLTSIFIGVLIWGVQMGMSQSIFMALIADMAPKDLRGTAFGFFYLVSSISAIISGIGAKTIVDNLGEAALFLFCSIISAAALTLVFIIRPAQESTGRNPLPDNG